MDYLRYISMAGYSSPSRHEKKEITKENGFITKLQEIYENEKNALENLFQTAASRFNIPVSLLKAVAQVESGMNPKAISRAGAQGIMQLMPATARSLGVTDPFNPFENILAGARYLRSLLDKFQGDEKLALAAYNAGPGTVKRYGGMPPFKETQNYVRNVLKIKEQLQGTLKATSTFCETSNNPTITPTPINFNLQLLQLWADLLLAEATSLLTNKTDKKEDF